MDVGEQNFRFTLDDPEKKSRAIRYPMSAELHVSSLDRVNSTKSTSQTLLQLQNNFAPVPGSSSTQCSVQTKRALLYGYFNRIALTEAQLYLRIPTIITGYNDSFLFGYVNNTTAASGVTLLTVAPGFYTTTSLAGTLQALIRTQGGLTSAVAFTVTGPTTSANVPATGPMVTGFTFATNTIDYVAFNNPLTLPAPPTLTASQKASILRFYRLIGVNAAAVVPGLPGAPATATSVTTYSPNWLPTDYIDIVSKKLTNYKETKDTNSSEAAPLGVIGRVYLTDAYSLGYNTTGYIDPNSVGSAPICFTKKWAIPNWSQWSPNQAVDSIDITLLDMWGNIINWTNSTGCQATEWEMTFVASE